MIFYGDTLCWQTESCRLFLDNRLCFRNMIKAGIVGAGSKKAGELIRILVNHPDVEIEALCDPDYAGRSIHSVHHGLEGEFSGNFISTLDPDAVDVVFVAADSPQAESIVALKLCPEAPKIIDMRPMKDGELADHFVYGLSEIGRKPMVRGAVRAKVASPIAAAALVSLYPLAANLLLAQDLTLDISCPDDFIDKEIIEASALEIASRLKEAQKSYDGKISIITSNEENPRGLRLRVTLPIGLGYEEVCKVFDSIYDDHNFTFYMNRRPKIEEVVGTNKCLIGLIKPSSSELSIDTVVDCRMRGGAGEAVHVMNLLFGLHERTGLQLKASTY